MASGRGDPFQRRFNGVKYSDYVIYDLSKPKVTRYDDHTKKMLAAKQQKEAA